MFFDGTFSFSLSGREKGRKSPTSRPARRGQREREKEKKGQMTRCLFAERHVSASVCLAEHPRVCYAAIRDVQTYTSEKAPPAGPVFFSLHAAVGTSVVRRSGSKKSGGSLSPLWRAGEERPPVRQAGSSRTSGQKKRERGRPPSGLVLHFA